MAFALAPFVGPVLAAASGGAAGTALLGGALSAGASLLGGALSDRNARNLNAENAATQREFAQMGIQWRVEDAKKAGLHPLYALAGTGATFNPTAHSTGNLGRGISAAGQAAQQAIMNNEAFWESRTRQRRNLAEEAMLEAQGRWFDARTASDNFDRLTRSRGEADVPAEGATRTVPVDVKSKEPGRPDVIAGAPAGFVRVRTGPDDTWLLMPDGNWCEQIGEGACFAIVAAANFREAKNYYTSRHGHVPADLYKRTKEKVRRALKKPKVFKYDPGFDRDFQQRKLY